MNALLEVWNQVKISPDRCLNSVVACCLSALTHYTAAMGKERRKKMSLIETYWVGNESGKR